MSTHKSEITGWHGRFEQADYNTPTPSGGAFRRIISNTQTVADVNTNFEDDAEYETGSDLASDMWATTHNASLPIPEDFNFQDIGFRLYDILGAVSESGSNPYTHIFSPFDVSNTRQPPARTYVKQYGALKKLLLTGGVLTSLKLSGGKMGRLKVESQVNARSAEEITSGYSEPANEEDREYGYAQQAWFEIGDDTVGTAQVETATAAGTITGAGNLSVVVTAAGMRNSPKTIPVAVAGTETAAQAAALIRAALAADDDVADFFAVSGATTAIILTRHTKAADDATLNIALSTGTATGLTAAPTSANTTAGVAGDNQVHRCKLQSWNLTLNNPEADDGYSACSEFLEDGNPQSGALRAEYLVGSRDYMFDFETWLEANDKMRGWLLTGKNLKLVIRIRETVNDVSSLTIVHTKCRAVSAKENVSGNFIGITGQLKFMSTDGVIPLTATLVNDYEAYVT